MGRLFIEYLKSEDRKYACKECLTSCAGGHSVVHLAAVSDLLSKSFHSRHGPAYLFTKAINVTLGNPEEREMTTGKHVVRDLFCISCGSNLGWRYEIAVERREKYKEGKYILERLQLVDLEAASTAYPTNNNNTTTRLLPPPSPSHLLLSSSAGLTTAAVPGRGTAGASPTGVMAMAMMSENGGSSGERSPLSISATPPPPPPPARTRFDFPLVPAQNSNRERSNRERTRDEEDVDRSMPELIDPEPPALRAFFSNWLPRTTTTTTTITGAAAVEGEAIDVNGDVAMPAAITDTPSHFNINL